MEILHHVGFRNDSACDLLAYLKCNGIPFDEGEDISAVDIYESSPHWQFISSLLSYYGLSSLASCIYTKEELAAAEWIDVWSIWRNGYPQPEADFGYESITYNRNHYCPKCGIGLQQVDSFRLKKEPKWGKRNFFQLNWIGDELFVNDRARNIFETNNVSGIDFLPVKDKTGKQVFSNVHQIVVNTRLDSGLLTVKTEMEKVQICEKCGEIKYLISGRTPCVFRRDCFNGVPDIVKTGEYFGDRCYASSQILIRQNVYQLIINNNLERGLVFQRVELV